MNELLKEICTELGNVANALKPYASHTIAKDWTYPQITVQELMDRVFYLVDKIEEYKPITIDDVTPFEAIPAKLQHMVRCNIPNIFGDVGYVNSYIHTMAHIEHLLEPLFSWETLADKDLLPKNLVSQLRSIQADISNFAPDKEKLASQIKRIQEATAATESLPTDLERLAEAKQNIAKMTNVSEQNYEKIQQKHQEIESLMKSLMTKEQTVNELIKKSEDAFKMATTVGLSGAFDKRAGNLEKSVKRWVFLLILALSIGGWLGYRNMQSLLTLTSTSTPQWEMIRIYFILSLASFGAPLWFAWLATKQIGQRFKLAEDYAFKASVAKAYEGYKTEAARLDKDFEARLFSSALSRLEEAPLRFMNNTEKNSPVHEIINFFTPAKTQQTELKQSVKPEPE
ncbi:MAG: hypothetical protein K2P98_01830 [Neisseriaceae bacterium]|nr:hypothetical protein [Neisseriaceae bacterium]